MPKDIQKLLARYKDRVLTNAQVNPVWVNNFNDLRLVDACQDKIKLNKTHPNHPLQIGIVGPTQAGKSTLVNLLTSSDAAGISALAGFTVHAQGFGVNVTDEELAPIKAVLEPMQHITPSELNRDNLDAYLLEPITAGQGALVQKAVVWDSPDFDSIEARGYRGAVLYTIALSDVMVLMVSKDKYGDKAVWDMLNLMVPLNKPIIVAINKLNEGDKESVLRSFNERFSSHFPKAKTPVIATLPYVEKDQAFSASQLSALAEHLETATEANDRSQLNSAVEQFINANWSCWVEPAEHEQKAKDLWQREVQLAVKEAFEQYEARYLNDDSRNDVFNRALAELLTLLEIPGIAASLQKTREVVTWPVRKIFGMGMDAVKNRTGHAPPEDLERDVLQSVQSHVLTKLQGVAVDAQQDFPEQSQWWQSMIQELRAQRASITETFDDSSEGYQKDFAPRIEAAADRLYQQLKTQPTLLNSLRAARVTTDAAAVALAVKSGGLAATDLLVAPAMLSVTTLLTESALGRYMDTVKAELKQEQRQEVKRVVFDAALAQPLLALPNTMDQSELLGFEVALTQHA